jgi:hypothetical protein
MVGFCGEFRAYNLNPYTAISVLAESDFLTREDISGYADYI